MQTRSLAQASKTMESGPPPLETLSESQNDQIGPVPLPSELASIITMLTAHEVKHAILYRLQLTAEEYRRRFRSAAVDHTCSSFVELVLRLTNLFGKWTEQTSVSDFAGLKDLIIREQLLNTLPVPARQFVN